MKVETEVDGNLQIEIEPKGVEEKDSSSDDSIADPNYHIENNDLSSDSDETVEENEEENISRESNQNITRKRKARPEVW